MRIDKNQLVLDLWKCVHDEFDNTSQWITALNE